MKTDVIDYERTVPNLTNTSDGEIPHLLINGLQCPVKLRRVPSERGYVIAQEQRLPVPLYRYGKLVFALPGGGEVYP